MPLAVTLPYLPRLLLLCFASFFLLHAALEAAVGGLTPWALHGLRRLAPRPAAQALFGLRILPALVALLVVTGSLLPSYFWLEKRHAESVGALCCAAALLGLTLWLVALARAGRGLWAARRFGRECRLVATSARLGPDGVPASVIPATSPLLAMIGIWRPQFVISSRVADRLPAEQLALVLRHEQAHGRARDNLKRLLLLLTPPGLPGLQPLHAIEREWERAAEWAADDTAAAGDPGCRLALAAALVHVARMGKPAVLAPLATGLFSTVLTGNSVDLAQRVRRLIEPRRSSGRFVVPVGASALAVALVATLVQPHTLHLAHALLETLIR